MSDKAKLLESIFADVAEQLGDITRPVMARTYELCPEAREAFEVNCLGGISSLEANMVEQTLYCVMDWIENQDNSKITLLHTLPHHTDTLNVPLKSFYSMFEALFGVVENSVLNTDKKKQELWQEIKSEIHAYVHGDAMA